jgi:[ribosomal protein S18]-alanine N-acetyltransferase
MIKIRLATKEDLEEITDIEFQSGFFDNEQSCLTTIKEILENENVFVAVEENKIAGYISLTNQGEIGFLAVDKKMRRKGIGNELIKKAISFGKNKLKKLYLDVRKDNIPAVSLYLKNGFSVTKENENNGIVKLKLEKRVK